MFSSRRNKSLESVLKAFRAKERQDEQSEKTAQVEALIDDSVWSDVLKRIVLPVLERQVDVLRANGIDAEAGLTPGAVSAHLNTRHPEAREESFLEFGRNSLDEFCAGGIIKRPGQSPNLVRVFGSGRRSFHAKPGGVTDDWVEGKVTEFVEELLS